MVVEASLYSVMAPLIPHYKHELGLTKSQAGVLVGSYALGTLISSLPAAVVATRVGVKRTLLFGLLLLSVSSVLFGIAQSVPLLVATRFLQGAAGGVIWSAGLTWVSALAPAASRGSVLGSLTGVAVAGTLLGPPAGALAAATSPEVVFGAIPVFGLVLIVLVAHLPLRPAEPSAPPWRVLGRATRATAGIAFWLVFAPAMALGLLGVLGPLRLSHAGAGIGIIAAAFVVAALAEAVANPIAGHLADRFGMPAVTVVALPTEALFLVLLAVSERVFPLALAVVACIALAGAFWAPAAVVLSAATSRAGVSDAYAFALYNVAWAAGQGTGSAGGGAIAQLTSDAVPCLLLGLALLSTIALVVRNRASLLAPRTVQA
jgi:predicted MFS family arabinose efflux permease